MTQKYDFKAIEQKWRPYWQSIDLYKTGADPNKPKQYILDFFPYPSGAGLSVGHARNYVPTCVAARYKRLQGYNVLHPMGWDAFGLPAENYAIQHGVHPKVASEQHSATYKRQMQLMACSYDWSREFSSTDVDFYRWTQWFFLLLFKRGLAYQALGSQWWCPVDKTILANEQVENGRCWRCGSEVTKKELKQWYFKITDYAERLLDDLDTIDWPDAIKTMQRNWIGRSEGAEITFAIQNSNQQVGTFTTRPDTLFGVTFLVIAPEHPLVEQITTAEQHATVTAYVEQAKRMSEIDRLSTDKEKTGVFSGAYAIHPTTRQPIPIWVADYVLMGYGTGVVMGVPGHDSRDFAFASRYELPIIKVIAPIEEPDGASQGTAAAYTEPGIMINSGPYNGLSSDEGGRKIVADLAQKGLATPTISYKVRDWLISRQRYWGAPIPIVHCPDCGPVTVPDEDLPVILPDIEDYEPTGDGRSPLAKVESWVQTPCPQCNGPAHRETDTMDGFACSSWYFLRFASPHEADRAFDPEAVKYWLPVDTYIGGVEHAVMHLLYARFWTKVMYDAGLVDFEEPFSTLKNQGVLHAASGLRMSKSKGNVVRPDDVIAEHGADAFRTYIVFIGPFEGDVLWNDTNIKGVNRFLERYWYLAQEMTAKDGKGDPAIEDGFRRQMHRLIQRITSDFEQYKFNTAVAAFMEYMNYLYDQRHKAISLALWQEALETYTQLLCPIAPFITEEIWQTTLGHANQSVHQTDWPRYDEALTVAQEVTMIIQINGKVRDQVTVAADMSDEALETAVLAREKVQRYVNGQEVQKIIIVPQRLVNVVVQ